MKSQTVYIVVASTGYWGAGRTSAFAAQQCFKAGASKRDHVGMKMVFRHDDSKPLSVEDVSVDSFFINYPQDCELLTVVSMDQHLKLGALL